jgi:predicted Zn-dependent peptidase
MTKMALQIGAISNNQEDYGMYILYGLPQASTSENLLTEIDAEIVKLQTELISDKELQSFKTSENQYVNSNASIEGVASNLATYYMLYNDVNLINTEIEMYRTITPEDIRTVAKNI